MREPAGTWLAPTSPPCHDEVSHTAQTHGKAERHVQQCDGRLVAPLCFRSAIGSKAISLAGLSCLLGGPWVVISALPWASRASRAVSTSVSVTLRLAAILRIQCAPMGSYAALSVS